jgi:hypothetical protein
MGNILSRQEISEVVASVSSNQAKAAENNVHRFYNGNSLAVSNHINQVVHGNGLSDRDKLDMNNVAHAMIGCE